MHGSEDELGRATFWAQFNKTPNPQQVIYTALHQDYSEGFVFDQKNIWPSETKCGEILVKRLLVGDRGHYGCLERATRWPRTQENLV